MNPLNLTITTITPPDGLAHTNRKDEILSLPDYLRVNAGSASPQLTMLFVSSSEPGADDTDKIWLKTDEAGTCHGFYRYDSTTGVWLMMAGPGIISGTTAPTDTTILWLKTDATGTAKGLYKYVATEWVNMTATPIPEETVEIVQQATAPTGSATLFWLKTVDDATPRGIHFWNGDAWVNGSAINGVSNYLNFNSVKVGSTPPDATIRPYTLWGKCSIPPVGVFWFNFSDNVWESISPIIISARYPDTGSVNLTTGAIEIGPLPFSTICPTIGSAYFLDYPAITMTLEYDDQFPETDVLKLGCVATSTTFTIAASTGITRNAAMRLCAMGRMGIPV